MLGPPPPTILFVIVRFSMTPPSSPQPTYFLNDHYDKDSKLGSGVIMSWS